MQAEKECDNDELIDFCTLSGIEFTIVPSEAHDTQGEVDKGNGSIKAFVERLKAESPRISTENALWLGTAGKKFCFGNKIASADEMKFG